MSHITKKVAVIAAHPDDEVLGCGATIAKHIKDGDEVHVLIMAEGITSRDTERNREIRREDLSELTRVARKANEVISVTTLGFRDLPDNRIDSIDLLDVIKTVESFFDRKKPDIVYTHHIGDLNIDHRRIHEAVVTACRPQPGCSIRRLLFFEVVSNTGWNPLAISFSPNWFVDVGQTLDLKLSALEVYRSEMRNWPHARSIKAVEQLSRWRGSSIGAEAAEAFVLGRNIC